MLKPGGYTFEIDPSGKLLEGETFMCVHCNRHTHIRPGERATDIGAYCMRCNGPVCRGCARLGECDPLAAKIERWEKSG